MVDRYPVELTVTPNQDILFSNIPTSEKERFIQDLESFGFGQRHGETYSLLRKQSGACVGRITCRLAYTDSETFEPVLIDDLEKLGWGHINTSIGVTGCERQCYRPATKAIGLVGSGLNLYQLKLMGTEDGRHQGEPLVSEDGTVYLGYIPREQVVPVIDTLFRFYVDNRQEGEELGYYHRRIGLSAIINNLKSSPQTAWLMANNRPINKLAATTTIEEGGSYLERAV